MYNELPGKVLAINCRGMWTNKKTDITKMRIDMEQPIPQSIQQGQKYTKMNAAMALYREKE